MDKADKKARLEAWRDQQQEAARSALPLPDSDMEALFDMLNESLPEAGCDHTRRLTEAWLAQHGHPVQPVHSWLDENGGFCDCEILANSEEAWLEASGKG